jgi:hypothetical protein
VAIRRSEAEALAQMVEDARHGREMADRIARLRERTADRLISGDWRLLRHHPDPKENSGPPLQRCLYELLLAIGEEGSRAWIEDRQVSSFSTINNQIPITSIEEVLAALLEAKAVSTIEWIEARRVLRRLGYAFLPFDEEELLAALAAAPVHDHGLSRLTR